MKNLQSFLMVSGGVAWFIAFCSFANWLGAALIHLKITFIWQ